MSRQDVERLIDIAKSVAIDYANGHECDWSELRAALAEALGGWRPISEADKNGHSRITGVWTQGEWLTFGMSFWNDEDPGYWWETLRAQRIRNQPTHTLDAPEYPPINKPPEATP